MDDLAAMARLIEALRPWLGQVIVVGGWAHQLHRHHPYAQAPAHEPLRTRDADFAFALSTSFEGDIGVALQGAGFQEELLGEDAPPATHYRLSGEDQGFYAEFLAPRSGSRLRRGGRRDATVARAGVTAQKLRHIDVLLVHPWDVRLDQADGFPVSTPAVVLLANPVVFIAQKLLIHDRREADKKAQDALYIHDTLELFGHNLEVLRTEWRDRVLPSLAGPTVKKVDRLRREQFAAVTDVIRNAVRIPQDRTLTPDRMREACAYGLEGIFGTS